MKICLYPKSEQLVASQLVVWQQTHARKNRGGERASYVDTLLKETGLNTIEEVTNCMGAGCVANHVNPRASTVAGDSTGVRK